MAIKFNKFNVTDTVTKLKARIFYSLDNRVDGRKCVTLYAKDYDDALGKILPDGYSNRTDTQTDYFDEGSVNLFEDSPYYAAARKVAEGGKADPVTVFKARDLPEAGARVGVVCGPGEFARDNSGIVLTVYEDQWGTHAVVMMDDGTTRTCEGLTTVGIGWYLLETAKA